jgi:hypothetical protein
VNSPHSRMIQLVQATTGHANPRRNSDLGGGALERVERGGYSGSIIEQMLWNILTVSFARKRSVACHAREIARLVQFGLSVEILKWSKRGPGRSLHTRIHEQKLGDIEMRPFLY